jgi:hypothetical protein
MPSSFEQFTTIVISKIHALGYLSPSKSIVKALLNTAYLATLKTEEGRFVRGSLTFADPIIPEHDPPLRRRANYPSFTPFGRAIPLTVERLVKLSRAIDSWCGSIAVHASRRSSLLAWGMIDQAVQHNVSLNREGTKGFRVPGILSVVMDGVGAISAYHGSLLLGGIRQEQVVTREYDALNSAELGNRLHSTFRPIAVKLSRVLGESTTPEKAEKLLQKEWSRTVARICIGLRRAGTGGALLITPNPDQDLLNSSHQLPYSRLGHAMILNVLDAQHRRFARQATFRYAQAKMAPVDLVREEHLADADAEDREDELAGAVRIVTSLASMDGLVLLTPLLEVNAFGTKIRSGPQVNRVYLGPEFARRGTKAKPVDISRFGTRHGSMLQYCQADRKAIGIVVSQDGHVRLILSAGKNLTLWENVQLLDYESDVRGYARMLDNLRHRRSKLPPEKSLGYTDMPKTFSILMNSQRSYAKLRRRQISR